MRTSFILKGLVTVLVSLFALSSCKKESNEDITTDGSGEVAKDTVITNAETEAVGHTADSVDIKRHLDSINDMPQ